MTVNDSEISAAVGRLSRMVLVDSRNLGSAGAGGASFQDAIQAMNQQKYADASRYFNSALSQGLDPLRQGYAYAQLGEICLKLNDLNGAIVNFVKVFDRESVLYESADTASKYLSVILDETGRRQEAMAFQQVAAKTTARLGYSLSPQAASRTRLLAREASAKTP